MSPTSCCFAVMRSLLEWVRSEWKCKKKATPNLSIDCRFFSVIAETLGLRRQPDRKGGHGKGAYAFPHGRATARFLAQMFVAISLRRHRRDLAKQCREVALILKAGAQPDLDYRQLAFDQQPPGEIDPAPRQELNRRRAGGLFERPREVERAQFGYLGDFGQRQIVFEVFFDEFGHAAQLMFRQPAEMMLEPFSGGRIMPEHMGHKCVDQRFGVNRPAGRPRVYFGGQSPSDLMNQRVADFAVCDQVNSVGLNKLSRPARDEIGI